MIGAPGITPNSFISSCDISLSWSKREFHISASLDVSLTRQSTSSILCVGTELTPHFHFNQYDCFIWQVYQAVAATSVIIAVDTILILRGLSLSLSICSSLYLTTWLWEIVFALFKNSPIIHNIIRIAFAGEIICMILGITLAIPKVRYNDICLVVYAPTSFALW
jgi:hypothetical protein